MSAKVKVWRVHPEASAHFEVHEDAAIMAANGKNFIAVDRLGVTVRGAFSVAAMGNNQRTGGLFTRMPEWAAMLPSTIVTPIPQVVLSPPFGIMKHIVAGVGFGMAFLAAGGA